MSPILLALVERWALQQTTNIDIHTVETLAVRYKHRRSQGASWV